MLVILTGCGKQEQDLDLKLADGSELQLSAKIIDSTSKTSKNGELLIHKLTFASDKETATAELDARLLELGYKKQIISKSTGMKIHYAKNSLPTIGAFFPDNEKSNKNETNANIYWHVKK